MSMLSTTKPSRRLAADQSVFQRGGLLVQILHDHSPETLKGIRRPANSPRIVGIREASLRERLSFVARFVKKKDSEDGEELIQVHPARVLHECRCSSRALARRAAP